MLVNAIITKLKTGSIPTVILYTDTDEMPEPPYVIVKPENGAIPGTRQFRIIVHHKKGQFDSIDSYIFKELSELLIKDSNGHKVYLTDEGGDTYQVFCGGWSDVISDNQDQTISMERIVYHPMRNGG